jgi:hypothetical protein
MPYLRAKAQRYFEDLRNDEDDSSQTTVSRDLYMSPSDELMEDSAHI